MTAAVFLGPTLEPGTARSLADVQVLPPVSQGDVYRAVQNGFRIIGIVDGYFEQVPAVWHKEILWAMSQGVHVFGAASMGALRAAELADFGMKGVGRVFCDFYSGSLEDDDEVAVVHGPAEVGYPCLSEAMVNIRATLGLAEAAKVIDTTAHKLMLDHAKTLHFSKRSYKNVADGVACDVPVQMLSDFFGWLPGGRADVKHDDACEMLAQISALMKNALHPMTVSYKFEHTDTWERLIRQAGRPASEGRCEGLMEELRLDPDLHAQTLGEAAGRALAAREASRLQMEDDGAVFDAVLNRFFLSRDLVEGAEIEEWMANQQITVPELTSFMKRQVVFETAKSQRDNEIRTYVPDALRAKGQYGRLSRRAEEKAEWLRLNGKEPSDVEATGLCETELVAWYFKTCLQKPVPRHIDAHIQALGFKSKQAFLQALAREFLFRGDSSDSV
ncbi:TfuA-like protein [Roseibium denhamense]|uniref:TfuA-like core domain-containing protein n=1 Tax=Roseibium denhamense TaxID=76305 RepID=A0ABY1NGB9_9HYPH|nr:TfuA-like protein [Roseibium denhamense]SMP08907.1 hypothetical protein SAMN06265374_1039 [Roseibium denhamense]